MKTIAFILVLALTAAPALGAPLPLPEPSPAPRPDPITIRVPQDYSTIQGALDASQIGDEVVVSPGVYNEHLEIGRRITLRSTFEGDWGMVERTVIQPPASLSNLPAIVSMSPGTTIRGFRITRDTSAYNPFPGLGAPGIQGSANIQYCIIENQSNVRDSTQGRGGAIFQCGGSVIENNIIRNNRADIGAAIASSYNVVIRNNLIYNNDGFGELAGCSGQIAGNTLSNNNSGFVGCTGTIANNILWSTEPLRSMDAFYDSQTTTPNFCIIEGYTGPGRGNIDADPQFVDPANGDFRLRAGSPAIDAGATTAGIKADFNGVQRGLTDSAARSGSPAKGDGTGVDIGAFEYIPGPVAVWFQGGQPDTLAPGDAVEVGWQMDETGGTAVLLELVAHGQTFADFGAFWNPTRADVTEVRLPPGLPTRGDYQLEAVSSYDHSLRALSAPFAIPTGLSGISSRSWTAYY